MYTQKTCTHMCTVIQRHTHVCVHVHTCTYAHTHTHAHIHTHARTRTHTTHTLTCTDDNRATLLTTHIIYKQVLSLDQ